MEVSSWENQLYYKWAMASMAMLNTWYRWPIEIDGLDGLPINSMVMFHGYVK